ncbi:MAG TPA: glycosyltransferase family 4 protein, partial [Candidatus Caccomorpha excrementavium]|nr:glycosyltransferase family 4 protein [Candidatus Caccomorpha excrementavium]
VGGFLPQFEMGHARVLQRLGYEVHYASNFRMPVYGYSREWLEGQGIVCHQIDFERSPYRIPGHIRAYRQLKELIRSVPFHIIHCHTPVGGVLTRLAARKSRKGPQPARVLYTAHGFHFYRGGPPGSWLLFYPIESRLSLYTDVLLTINREDYEQAKRFCVEWRCRPVQIPGVGIRPEFYGERDREAAEAKRREFGIEENDFLIVSVGELNSNKNHEIVIRAMEGLSDVHIKYLICGEGNRRKLLEQLIYRTGLEERVKLAGFRKDIAQILACADCFAFPSKREGLGMAAIEAMASGLPVIAGDNRGTREYMIDGTNGIVCRNRPEEYRNAIRKLSQDPKLRRRMGEKARKMALHYDAAHSDEAMKEIYRWL